MADEPKRKKKEAAGAPAWMCTFADMMSLLLCFFVLILSFSSLDQPSFQKVAGSLRDAFGIQKQLVIWGIPKAEKIISKEFDTVPVNLKQQIEDIFANEVTAGLVEVEEDNQEILVRLRDSVVFDSGRAAIKQGFLPLLNKLGQVMVDLDASMVVSGHTDNRPLRKGAKFTSNWQLSAARAVAVVEYLARKYRIPSNRLSAVAYADGRPLASNATAEGRARNRRVEFKIRPNKAGMAFEGLKELEKK